MIDRVGLIRNLESRFASLDEVSKGILRGVDLYDGRPYAVRYFDLSDDILSVAAHLSEYQERIIGGSYFDPASKADLRWNYYLYFLTSVDGQMDEARAKAKADIEADREYARKLVLTETELGTLLGRRSRENAPTTLPPDPFSEWTKTLEKHDLGFVVDESLQVPAIARQIARGDRQGLRRPPQGPALDEAERQVFNDSLRKLTIRQFRRYPSRKEYEFGTVNLIMGVNGVGKTSLLEAIEYLFCGRVRRSDDPDTKASIGGVLEKCGLEIETTSSTPTANLRARHLAWYGKADVKVATLHNSFSKFNFLDTDAAVHLTIEKSEERINADLAKLLLGAEASKTLVRFERLEKALIETTRDLEREVAIHDDRRLNAMARLQELHKTPQPSDELFSELKEALARVGWATPISAKTDADTLSTSLQTSLVNMGILRAAGLTVPIDPDQLEIEREHLTRAEALARRIRERKQQLDASAADIKRRVRELEIRTNALTELNPILDAGISEIAQQLNSNDERIAALTIAIASAEPAAAIITSEDRISGMPLRQALEDQTKEVEQRTIHLNDAKRTLDVLERTQAAVTNLTQQLRSVARQIVGHTHDQAHCPLCGTEFLPSELGAFMDENTQSSASSESRALRSQVNESEAAYQRASTVLNAIRVLSQYPPSPGSRATVRSILARITADRTELTRLQSDTDQLRQRTQEYAKRGWTLERLSELARVAALSPSEVNRQTVDSVISSLKDERVRDGSRLAEVDEERQNLDSQADKVCEEYRIPSRDLSEAANVIFGRISALAEASRAVHALRLQMTQAPVMPDLELEAHLREAHELAVRVLTSNARERDLEESIKNNVKALADATAEVAALRIQVARAGSARAVIADLMQKQSGRALTNEVLHENGAQIAALFARIHAPSEFDVYVEEDGLKILRRATGTKVELHEMSSGQRAAFTLSLFLAMNGRLRTGPRVIIFDDPVAHVDDINTLSFLDELREIAIGGERQLFFATADSKLAGLFSRKFRFMGDQFKQIELTRD